ncbi:MAG: molybdenum cofactor guanylyltransferase [Alphaproteobacteria bacterium]|nr:molybdenum cofactor guanylyltransferase [Alphaproteobacteria bacterium]
MPTVSLQGLGFPMDKVGVVILAGGLGTRMGGGKPERLFRGRRLIDPVLDRASAWRLPTVLCVRKQAQLTEDTLGQLLDRPDIEGPLAGLLAALDWATGVGLEHILTLPCDTPFLPEDVLARLLSASRTAGAPAVAASNARRHPTCAVWPRDSRSGVEAYAATGRRSLSGALDNCAAVDVFWPLSTLDPFVNINTPGDIDLLEISSAL